MPRCSWEQASLHQNILAILIQVNTFPVWVPRRSGHQFICNLLVNFPQICTSILEDVWERKFIGRQIGGWAVRFSVHLLHLGIDKFLKGVSLQQTGIFPMENILSEHLCIFFLAPLPWWKNLTVEIITDLLFSSPGKMVRLLFSHFPSLAMSTGCNTEKCCFFPTDLSMSSSFTQYYQNIGHSKSCALPCSNVYVLLCERTGIRDDVCLVSNIAQYHLDVIKYGCFIFKYCSRFNYCCLQK